MVLRKIKTGKTNSLKSIFTCIILRVGYGVKVIAAQSSKYDIHMSYYTGEVKVSF